MTEFNYTVKKKKIEKTIRPIYNIQNIYENIISIEQNTNIRRLFYVCFKTIYV